MPDDIFAMPRLVQVYDAVEGERGDLDHYLAIAAELDATSVLDVGCGTGTFACLLARRGYTVTGVEPAAAMLAAARAKPGAERVHWVHGDAKDLPDLRADLAVMTGNTAQVFLTDQDWAAVLDAVSAALRPGGHLVFEVRDPAGQPWLGWNRDATWRRLDVPGAGQVETWWDLTGVTGELISFRRTFVFAADGVRLTSESTRRFRPRTAIEQSLQAAGYTLAAVREAPDRPGREMVFIARRH
jgi:SAM-dependent methyltransferase